MQTSPAPMLLIAPHPMKYTHPCKQVAMQVFPIHTQLMGIIFPTKEPTVSFNTILK